MDLRNLSCLRKLGESKTAAAVMAKLEMFSAKYINKNLICFSGFSCNYRLALCLVHLIKEYPELQVINMLLNYLFGKSLRIAP